MGYYVKATPSQIVPAGPSDPAWWQAAAGINYRTARIALRAAREWLVRLRAWMRLRRPPKRLVALALDALLSELNNAQYWRNLARANRKGHFGYAEVVHGKGV